MYLKIGANGDLNLYYHFHNKKNQTNTQTQVYLNNIIYFIMGVNYTDADIRAYEYLSYLYSISCKMFASVTVVLVCNKHKRSDKRRAAYS